jgi:hypothetical protein
METALMRYLDLNKEKAELDSRIRELEAKLDVILADMDSVWLDLTPEEMEAMKSPHRKRGLV